MNVWLRANLKLNGFMCFLANLVGILGLTKYTNGRVSTRMPAAQTRSVVWKPNLVSMYSSRNGSTDPERPVPAHMMPYAMPLRLSNHSLRYAMHGQYDRELPIANSTPCVAIRWGTIVEKEAAMSESDIMKTPSNGDHSESRGQSRWIPIVTGMPKYIIP